MKHINKTVWLLSLVSLFADVASEMIYPVVPVYLKQIGFSILLIGILEGVVNFTAGISKGFFGKWSDEAGVRLPFVRLGYLLSAISKPMMAASIYPVWIFFARTTDRLGKGLRTAPRDALLSQNATPQTKATVFGFHRAMDTFGATLGPVVALLLLAFFPENYHLVFLLAFIPGVVSVLILSFLKEKKSQPSATRSGNFFSYLRYWNLASPQYKKLVVGLIGFAMFNSADVFLLLKTKEITNSDQLTIGAYIFYNLVFAVAAFPMGKLADKWGFKKVLISGFGLFAIVYFLFASSVAFLTIAIAFFLYGIYAAATEGVAKAWITNLAHEKKIGTAVGFYTSCESIASLLASIFAGWIWLQFGSKATFLLTAFVAVSVILYFLMGLRMEKRNA